MRLPNKIIRAFSIASYTALLKDLLPEIVSILVTIVFSSKISRVTKFAEGYYSESRMGGMIAFYAISIGIYVTVISIIGTSEISITRELLRRRLDQRILWVSSIGILLNTVAVLIITFMPNLLIGIWVVPILVSSIVSFMHFLFAILTLYKVNMDSMAREIDQRDQYLRDVLLHLENMDTNSTISNKNN